MLDRCYRIDRKGLERYIDCEVCEEWKTYSNFVSWYDNNWPKENKHSFQLDKDLMVIGNKIYSPQTASPIPQDLNKIITNNNVKRNNGLPIGVRKGVKGYGASLKKDNKTFHIGIFDTIDLAFNAYKTEKEKYIKERAQFYFDKGLINKMVYKTLFEYKVIRNR